MLIPGRACMRLLHAKSDDLMGRLTAEPWIAGSRDAKMRRRSADECRRTISSAVSAGAGQQ